MAALTIKSRQVGNAVLFDMTGKITIGDGSAALRTAIRASVDKGNKNIVLNMAGVRLLDSAGIGELVTSYSTCQRMGGQLRLLQPVPKVVNMLAITRLITVFPIYDTEAEAVDILH